MNVGSRRNAVASSLVVGWIGRESFRGSDRCRRRARICRRSIAGEVEMLEGRDREGDGFESRRSGERSCLRRRQMRRENHAAAKRAAGRHVLLVRIATGKLDRALMRADDIAEGVELGRRPGGEGTQRRLEQQEQRRDKRGRHAPSSQPCLQRTASPYKFTDPSMGDATGKSAKPRCGNAARCTFRGDMRT